ncbi:MarR family winged helix-turn-helix transcriptional regulator [Kibdelosporangium phytohabitans]|uniref:MarR family winged helix-turn-helix transcriptional regulator n=1 Tax=Kibdelosporangium phytohabitans TaxID=860235 RepID=UPI001A039305|nr:MarR family transcriptional regulator [Kibdelosporangium phytohabitans]MBE1465829.1 DNA-binding MarR family transcriptional regulator [Kibdelosporangium phytohabitans]
MADSIDQHIAYWSQQVPDLDVHVEGAITRMQGLVRLLWRRREAGLDARDLKGWEYDILWRVRSVGPPYQVSPTWLAKALDTHPATLTSRLERLEKTGHLTRIHDPADRRRLLVELTDLGHRSWEATIEDQAANEHELLAVLTDSERKQLSDLLRKVVTAAEQDGPPLMPPVEHGRP